MEGLRGDLESSWKLGSWICKVGAASVVMEAFGVRGCASLGDMTVCLLSFKRASRILLSHELMMGKC